MQIREFVDSDSPTWDAFVDRSFNGTLMHQRQFLSYHAADRFRDRSILITDAKGALVGVFPAAIVVDNGQTLWKSHPGASYGGLVVRSDFASIADSLIEQLVSYARSNHFDAIWLRPAERVFQRHASDDLDAALFRAGFQLIGRELSSAVNLRTSDEHALLAAYHPNPRNSVVQARRRGITARISDDFPAYWELLRSNLESRHGVHPTHTLAEIESLRQRFGNRIFLVGGYLENQLVAGTVVFMMNTVAAHTMYMAQDYRFNEHQALPMVIYQALVECRARGLHTLNFGISTRPGSLGMELNAGLHAFKRRCGGQAVFREIWQWTQ